MIIVPFMPAHLDDFSLQPGQDEAADLLDDPEYGKLLASDLNTITAVRDDGVVLAIFGVSAQTENRALAWCLLGSHCDGYDMLKFTRYAKSVFEKTAYKRIEAIVKEGFAPARRWVEILGFNCETPQGMVNWFADGRRAFLYSRGK